MKNAKTIAILVLIISVLWIGSGFILPSKKTSEPPQQKTTSEQAEKELPEVRVRAITAENYTDDVVVTGRSKASKSVEIRAETAGLVTTLLKEEGAKVAAGDILAKIEVRDRESRVSEAQGRVNQRQIEYNAARRLAKEGFNSKVRVAQSLADLKSAKAALSDARSEFSKVDMIAPFDGIIAEQTIEAGDYVSTSDSAFTIVNLNPIEFVGFVSENRVQALEVNKVATIEFLNGQKLDGEVSYVAPAADPQTRTFRVVVSATNTDLKIKEGLTAKIYIPAAQKTAYKISPSILSLDDTGRIGVKIVDDQDITNFIPVKILADKSDAMWVEPISVNRTLPKETRFITVGQEFVGVGQKVKPVHADGDGLL